MVRWECVLGTIGLIVAVAWALYLLYLFLEIHVLPGRPVRCRKTHAAHGVRRECQVARRW